jgi:hypothetical protein
MWGGWLTPSSGRFTPGNVPVPIIQEAELQKHGDVKISQKQASLLAIISSRLTVTEYEYIMAASGEILHDLKPGQHHPPNIW